MAGEELLFFPRGQISIDGGNPQQVTDFDYDFTNGLKLKPTLRNPTGGIVLGAKAVSFSFNLIIDDEGEELDVDTMVDTGETIPIVAKFPGGVTKVILGAISSASAKFSIDDGVARAVKGVGALVLPAV